MTRRAVVTLIAGALACLAAPPRISRADLKLLELGFDRRLQQFSPEEPFDLLGYTRAAYLEDYGVVFTCEVNLVPTAFSSPFAGKPTPEALQKVRQKKLNRLPQLRQIMRDMMVSAGASLKTMPLNEKVVVGVTLFYTPSEDINGLPSQIVMQARRQLLADFEVGRIDINKLNAGIQETVY